MLLKRGLFLILAISFISCEGPMSMDEVENYYSEIIVNFPNKHLNLNWSEKYTEMTWDGAKKYCKTLGGRLPTINELRTLIKNCPNTESGGACGVTSSCVSADDCRSSFDCDGCVYDNSGKYSVLGDIGWFWSSSEVSDRANEVWSVDFTRGIVWSYSYYSQGDTYKDFRCVR